MKSQIKIALAAAIIAITPFSASAFESEEFCDFSRYENGGVKVQFSPMSMSNKHMARERFQNREIYPHFFYSYNTSEPVNEKSIVHRKAVVEGDQFYRVNEGSAKNPLMARYYKTIVDDCSRIYLRISENSKEFENYWSDRGAMKVSLDEFIEIHSHDISVIVDGALRNLRSLEGEYVTLAPIRGERSWYNQLSEDEFLKFDPSPQQKMKVVKLVKRPFIYRGNKLSPFTLKTALVNGSTMTIPGYSHSIVKWSNHKGDELEVGSSQSVLIAHKGIPDRIRLLPVFKTDSGKIIIEDEVLKERVSDGSGVNVSAVNNGEYIGYLKVFEYKNGSSAESVESYVVNMDGIIESIEYRE